MALRTIRVEGDPILRKECRPVKEMNERTHILINDMFDTMYEADGVGLAGPQVGILKRLCVIDCGDDPLVLINPEIVSVEGEQIGQEGCHHLLVAEDFLEAVVGQNINVSVFSLCHIALLLLVLAAKLRFFFQSSKSVQQKKHRITFFKGSKSSRKSKRESWL